MPQSLEIQIKTLTPLWTGGVDGTCDRLHVSGIIGSMRYWYEAIVRGVGGYACDPSDGGCIYKPLDEKKPETTGTKSICAACYLFGTTGWARLFRLSASADATEPLHFRTLNSMNTSWIETIFEGKVNKQPTRPIIEQQSMIFSASPISMKFIFRSIDQEYASRQLKMLFAFISTYAGLGPKQQFGFGQIQILSPQITITYWNQGLAVYKQRQNQWLAKGGLKNPLSPPKRVFGGEIIPTPALDHFFEISANIRGQIIGQPIKVGRTPQTMSGSQGKLTPSYLSSAFDIRYKGNGGTIIGLRRSLDSKNPHGLGWSHTSLNAFMGASRQKGEPEMKDEERSASRLFLTMPYQTDGSEHFILRMYGFALPELDIPGGKLTVERTIEICHQYLSGISGTTIQSTISGSHLLKGELA